MTNLTLLSLSAGLALAMADAGAATVSLSSGFGGPFAFQSDGITPVSAGTITLGSLNGTPSSGSISDIAAVFDFFGSAPASPSGGIGATITNLDASAFDQRQIYVWIFDGAADASASGHALLTVADPLNPASGSPWFFPVHTGNGIDSVIIELGALGQADPLLPGGARIEGNRIILAAVPEPSAALLAGVAGLSIITLRRRR